MDQDDKVKIEETSINLACVKKELDDEELEFEEKQYKIALTLENMFGQNLIEQKNNGDSLIGFSDGEVIMKIDTGTIKLDIKEETNDLSEKNIEQSHVEIIQCHCCKVWLGKQEHLESHMLYCLKNHQGWRHNISDFQRKPADKVENIQRNDGTSTPIDENKSHLSLTNAIHSNRRRNFSEKKHKCSECSYRTIYKNLLKRHRNIHMDIKPFECGVCKKKFSEKGNLKIHIKTQHSNTNEKEFKCSECSFQTNYKHYLKVHLNTHNDIKPFECGLCKRKCSNKRSLQVHVIQKHSNTIEKKHKCPECPYQTNWKYYLKAHMNTHNDIKAFECDICKKKFGRKYNLDVHTRNQHANISEKEHKCSECSYRTNYKNYLKTHLKTHQRDRKDINPFECGICKKKFTIKGSLKIHIKDQHSNTSEKEYKCSECPYETNHKYVLNRHLNTHACIECHICKKRFNRKINLKKHIKYEHLNTKNKEYKCTACSFQTKYKRTLETHANIHHDIKPFECDICKKGFTRKSYLKKHKQKQHLNMNEVDSPID